MSHKRYFNFPVCLLKDFLTDTQTALNRIYDYSIYSYSLHQEGEDKRDNIILALEFYEMDENYPELTLSRGVTQYKEAYFHAPKVGLSLDLFWDFYKNEKTEFEKVCLLAFLAIKSILGAKTFCKTDNKYVLSRMNGSACSQEFENLPDNLRKYANEYQMKKIKRELKNHWGLKTYSRYTRGFYVSFCMELEELMYHAEKQRKLRRLKLQETEEKMILERVLKKLANEGQDEVISRP